MARIEWIKVRLNNWALWVIAEKSGGLGFASQAAFLNDAPQQCEREARIPVDEIDASHTNEAVEALKLPKRHLYETLHNMYPRGLGVKESARRSGIAESTVKAHLEQADEVLRVWFQERAEKKAKDAAAMRARHDAIRAGRVP